MLNVTLLPLRSPIERLLFVALFWSAEPVLVERSLPVPLRLYVPFPLWPSGTHVDSIVPPE